MALNKKTFPLICLVVDLPLLNVRDTNISHLGKRNVIFKSALVGDMLVPWRKGQKIKQTHNNRLGHNHISLFRFSDVSRTRSARSAIHALIFLGLSWKVTCCQHEQRQQIPPCDIRILYDLNNLLYFSTAPLDLLVGCLEKAKNISLCSKMMVEQMGDESHGIPIRKNHHRTKTHPSLRMVSEAYCNPYPGIPFPPLKEWVDLYNHHC